MPSVAELQVVVNADTHAAESGLASLGAKVGSVGGTMATALGVAAVGGIVAVGAAFAGAVSSAVGFEQQMSAISAVSGATAGEMAQLSSLALDLGKNTSFSASEAAQGIEELIKAGVSIGDVMGGAAAASLSLAAAGAISVGEAAEIAANAMNQFGLKGTDLARVSDLIAGAANASAIDVNDFKFSLAAVGAVANAVGFSFEDTATSIALLGQAGIKGSDAGTSLKTMLLSLQPGTKAQTALFRELGLITEDGANKFFDASGKVKSMAEVAGTLQAALAGMTQQQKLAALETIFGSDAIRAAAVFANEGAEGFNEMAAAMGKVTAEAVAAERLNNVAGAFEQMKGSIETLGITIGMAFLPMLKAGIDGVTGFVNSLIPLAEQWGPVIAAAIAGIGASLMAMDWSPFLAVVSSIGETIIGIVVPAFQALMAAAQPVLAFLGEHLEILAGVAAAFAAFATIALAVAAISAVGAALAFLLSPIGLVVAAIGLLTAAWVGNWFGIQEATAAAIDFLVPYIQAGLAAIEAFWATHGETILAALSAAWEGIKAAVVVAIEFIGAVIAAGVALWAGGIDGAWAAIQAAVATAWAAIGAAIQAQIDAIGAAIAAAWAGFIAPIQAAIDAIGAAIQAGWDAVLAATSAAMAAIQAAIQAVWDLIPADIQADLILITTHLTTAGAEWLATITTAMTTIQTTMQTAWTAIQTLITTAMATIQAALLAAWAAISADVVAQMAVITAAVTTGWAAVLAVTTTTWAAIVAAITTAAAAAVSAVQAMGASILSTLGGLAGSAGAAATAIGTAIVNGIRAGVMAAAGALASAAAAVVRNALNAAKAAIGAESPSKVFRDEVGKPIPQGIMAGIEQMQPKLDAMLGGIVAPPSAPSFAGAGHGAVSGPVVTINVGGSLVAQADLEDTIAQAVSNSLRRGGTLGSRG